MKFCLNDFLELNTNELLTVNGGYYCNGSSPSTTITPNTYYPTGGGDSGGGGGSSDPKVVGGGCSATDDPKRPDGYKVYVPITTGGTCSNINLSDFLNGTTIGQKDFASKYGKTFGDNACAATSLLNEISSIYTKETGNLLSASQLKNIMDSAVKNGSIGEKNANVNNWEKAANTMLKAAGLDGSFVFTTDTSKADVVIYSIDKSGNGYHDHFVNDIGGGKYYDPWSKEIKNISEANLTSKWNDSDCVKSPYRGLTYKSA